MNLRDEQRRNIQQKLDFSSSGMGEAQGPGREETESSGAGHNTENPVEPKPTMEEICEWKNLKGAVHQVWANKGSAGIDGRSVDQRPDYEELATIRKQLLSGTYKPQPVRRVEIPKPDGGVRKLGIPTVMDRFIQQAVMHVLGPDVFRSQLRVSAWTFGASGGGGGTAVHRRRLSLGGGSGSGEVLRPGQSRQTDGKDCRTGERQEVIEADPGFSAS